MINEYLEQGILQTLLEYGIQPLQLITFINKFFLNFVIVKP